MPKTTKEIMELRYPHSPQEEEENDRIIKENILWYSQPEIDEIKTTKSQLKIIELVELMICCRSGMQHKNKCCDTAVTEYRGKLLKKVNELRRMK